MTRKIPVLAAAALLVAGGVTTVVAAVPASAATQICEKFGSTRIQGRFVVQNNNWGDDTRQCINVTKTGFSIASASHQKATNGPPGSYPSVYYGCHYNNCSPGTILPMRVSDTRFSAISTSVSMSYPGSGVFDASYDVWFDPTARKDGQNTGAEIMVWLNRKGAIQPVGSKIATVTLAGAAWDVFEGNIGWNVVSYVRQSTTTSLNFSVSTFFNDAVKRGFAQKVWFLTSIQAGFEPWVGGAGLKVDSFAVKTSAGGTAPSSAGSGSASKTGTSAAGQATTGATGQPSGQSAGGTPGSGTASAGTAAGAGGTSSANCGGNTGAAGVLRRALAAVGLLGLIS